jgi:hypothetical protein
MYSEALIQHRQTKLEARLGSVLPTGKLERIPVETCHAMVRALAGIYDPVRKQPTRPFTQEEQIFVANERLLTKVDYSYFAQRYQMIQAAGQRLQPMYPLWESQSLILTELGYQEETRWRSGHPDGLLFNILKGRQLGCSSLCQSLLLHRIVTHTSTKGLIASNVPDNSGSQGLFGMLERGYEHLPWWLKPGVKFWNTDSHLVLQNGSSIHVESGKSMKGGLQDQGGQKGQLGRSRTYALAHLSELSSWEYAGTIDDSLMPAIPETPQTLMARESTAKGRHNWWHEEWLVAAEGLGRCFNIFIPWYAERTKYWLPPPLNWSPSDDTLAFAQRVQAKGPQYMRRPITLSLEQLCWYESRKAEAIRKGQLYKFLEEYPAEPEEAFQYSGRSIFTIETMDRLERQARPMADLWKVAPHGELREDREQLMKELAADQLKLRDQVAAERLKGAQRVNNEPTPQTVQEEMPTVTEVEAPA